MLTTRAVFVLSDPANAITRESPLMIGEVASHPHAITLTYNPAVLGRLWVATSDCCVHTFTQTDFHNYFHIMSFQPTTINIEIMKYIWNKADLNVLAHLFHTNNFINVLIRTVLQLWLIWLSIDCSGILVQEIVFSFSLYTVHRQSFLFCYSVHGTLYSYSSLTNVSRHSTVNLMSSTSLLLHKTVISTASL